MKNTIITDTGFWVALANKNDQYHKIAKQCLHNLSTTNVNFITTCAVINETTYLLYRRVGREAQRKFITHYQNGLFNVFEIKQEHVPRINQLARSHAPAWECYLDRVAVCTGCNASKHVYPILIIPLPKFIS